ncbi:MAG: hypothetical protein BWY48_00560 [Parcubacteria group bacterium ADurb.Bin305]|nr:MAG: hypothetical protein BWY48_00560 [Parcubacteria group bacterium ADurb.Bin305]
MFILKMISGERFNITREDAQSFVGKSGLVPVKSLGGMINVSSISSILPADLVETRKKTNDGMWCVKRFGQWYNENTGLIVEPKYQNELDGAKQPKQIETSQFAKELANKFNL